MTQLSINTTQNVNINFTAASVGDRILAQLIDLLVKIAYIIVVIVIINFFDLERYFNGMDQWSVMGIFSLV